MTVAIIKLLNDLEKNIWLTIIYSCNYLYGNLKNNYNLNVKKETKSSCVWKWSLIRLKYLYNDTMNT